MTVLQDDLLPIEKVSLCPNCAKHPEIKELVQSCLSDGVCGVCGNASIPVFDPEKFEKLRNLIRALIRFHYDEETYNSHWGGTSVYDILLVQENPLLEIATCDDYVDEFTFRIEEEGGVYPDYDQGICLYAGHDEQHGRLLQYAIPKVVCKPVNDIDLRLGHQNFHKLEGDVSRLIERIVAELVCVVEKDSLWFRSRTGVKEKYTHFGFNEVQQIAVPFSGSEISALPPPIANAGRVNRQGVSVLYLADEVDTAVAEIRPHPGHLISVGGFRALRNLRVADFGSPISPFATSDARLDEYAIIYNIDKLLSSPVTPEDRHKYAFTQLLADELIRRGFDGVSYRSSVGTGKNLCAFDPHLFKFEPSMSQVKQVVGLEYSISPVAMSARREYEN